MVPFFIYLSFEMTDPREGTCRGNPTERRGVVLGHKQAANSFVSFKAEIWAVSDMTPKTKESLERPREREREREKLIVT